MARGMDPTSDSCFSYPNDLFGNFVCNLNINFSSPYSSYNIFFIKD